MKVLDGSHERAMLAWANSWISDRLDRMSKQGDSPNYEYGGSCGSAKGAQQLTFMYGGAALFSLPPAPEFPDNQNQWRR